MRHAVLLLLAVAASASSALAQKTLVPPPDLAEPPPAPPPGGVAVAGDRLAISPELCGMLSALSPAVPGADYVPGLDARGNPVAPADLPSDAPQIASPPIEIGVALRRRFHVASGSPLFRKKSVVGVVTIRDGRAWFNGAPLADNERDMMLAACREAKAP
jgi:hypothetical protein